MSEAQAGPVEVTEPKQKEDAASAEVAEMRRMIADLRGQVEAAQKEVAGHASKVEAFRRALIERHREAHLGDLIDPDLAALAPQIEIDDEGRMTETSARALAEWRAAKPHLFRKSESAAVAAPQPGHVPPVDVAGHEWTWERWDALRKEHPREWARRQDEYIAWALAQEQRR